jgi:translation initiation factor IF-1
VTTDAALTFGGVVTEEIRGATFRVTLDNGHKVTATASGRLRHRRIRVLPGDSVTVELGVYDLSMGRIIYRHNEGRT